MVGTGDDAGGVDGAWRVMTWNILGANGPDLAAIAQVVRQHAPDVLAVQEVRRAQARDLARLLGWRVRWARKHYPWTPLLWWRAEGLAVMSPHSLDAARRMTLTPDVSTWIYRHRVLLAATVTRSGSRAGADGQTLRCYNVHLSAEDPDRRIHQSTLVAALVDREQAALAVVAGDFNDASAAEVLRELGTVGLTDPGGVPTSPSVKPVNRLDYVVIPRAASVTGEWTPPGGQEWHDLSDHLPTLVAFSAAEPVRSAPSSGATPSQ